MQGVSERRGSVLEIRSAWPDFGTRRTHGTRGDEGISAIEVEPDPAERRAKDAGAVGLNVKRVGTAEVNSNSRGCVHNELAGGSPDGCVNCAHLELQAFVIGIDPEKTNTGIAVDLNFSEIAIGKRRTRRRVCGQSLADVEFFRGSIAGNGLRANLWRPFEISDSPTGAGWGLYGWMKGNENASDKRENDDSGGGQARSPRLTGGTGCCGDARGCVGKRQRTIGVAELGKQRFQVLDFGIGRARAVPQIIIGRRHFIFVINWAFCHSSPPVSGVDLRVRISRSCCIPR